MTGTKKPREPELAWSCDTFLRKLPCREEDGIAPSRYWAARRFLLRRSAL